MSSVRLTKSMRETILNRVLDHAFGAREKELQEAGHKIAIKAYERLHPKKVRDTMASLPKGYLDTSDRVVVTIGGQWHTLQLPERRPQPSDYDTKRMHLNIDDKLAIEVQNHLNARKALETERRTAKKNAEAVLEKVTTLPRLLKVWPEVEVFAADLAAKPVVALAIPMDDLNAKLRLPPEKRAA